MRRPGPRSTFWLVSLGLLGLTWAVYWPVARFGFVDQDDPGVVTLNPHVAGGLTAANARWALTGFRVGHWEPLTWWSLQADVSLWGGRPGPMHVENVMLHSLAAAVLFALLTSATGATARSAAVAAAFAVHPTHVESVAWITERRDVLSTPLLLAAVWAYGRYARGGGWRWQAAFLGLYGLSLSAKATGITLPAALLLVDRWPLRRSGWRRLLLEKVPAGAMAVAVAVVAAAAQREAGAALSLADLGVADRLANAVVTPWLYAWKWAVPTGLAAYYPLVTGRPWFTVAGALVALAAVTVFAWRQRDRRPYLLVGWGWFLIVLLPTSGLAQSGSQGMADRYAYVPSMGLTVAVVWGLADAVPAPACATAVAVAVAALAVAARRQTAFWHDTKALRSRIAAVTSGDATAHVWLGVQAATDGDVPEAERQFAEALRLDPSSDAAAFDLGNLRLRVEHRPAAAVDCYRRAAAARPDLAAVQANWGVALLQLGRAAEAYDHLRAAERIDPDAFDPHLNLGLMLQSAGRRDAAAHEFAEAVRCDPSSAAARRGLAEVTAR